MVRRVVARALPVLFLLTAVLAGPAASWRTPETPTATELLDRVVTLTTAEMAGRGSGTAGGERAARQIADWLAEAGLRPGGSDGTFFQPFPLATTARLGPGTLLEMTAPTRTSFETGRQWTAHGGSLRGEASGEIVFAGYGISLPEQGYDDYAGLDAQRRIVLLLPGAPSHLSAAGSSRLEKLILARSRGAAAALFVSDTLPKLDATAAPAQLVSGTVKSATADALLASTGRTIAGLRTAMAASRQPAPLATGVTARVRVVLEPEERLATNVIGIVPGDGALAGEAVVVAAHYDHLGVAKGVTYPGADDNASGTSVVVGLARAFARAAVVEPPARTLVFALFSGEELGLLGSAHYVRYPTFPMTRTVAMVNFDQVGRMRDRRLQIGGVDSGSGFRSIVDGAAAGAGVTVALHGAPYAPSDHTRFYESGVPVLFFHTGTHKDYHAPSDTADKINADGMARVAAIGRGVIERLAAHGGPAPVYARIPRERASAARVRNGAFLGVASRSQGDDGVVLDSIVPDSAAARAGLVAGDVLVRMAGASIESFDELRAALRDRRPGDTVRLVYIREGAVHETSTTLGE